MACTKCNKNEDCGCKASSVTINSICNPIDCGTEECSESFPAQCILYTGQDIICDESTIITSGDSVAQGLANIIKYFCDAIPGSGIVSNQFNYEIGQYVDSEGGVIAYRWLSTTPGGTPELGTVQNYIVVDTTDLSTSAQWSSLYVNISNVGSQNDGPLNTTNLIAAGVGSGITAGVAAELCNTSTNNGYSDWYLPAIDELSKIFQNRWDIAQGIIVAAGTQFGYLKYWSSSQEDVANPAITAYAYSFPVGGLSSEPKINTFGVRAVRRFSI